MLIGGIPRLHARNYPARIALVDEFGERLTWREFNRRVNRLAHAFVSLGVPRGGRLAVVMPNSVHFMVAYFAAGKSGLVFTAFNQHLTAAQIGSHLRDAEPEVLLVHADYRALINPADTGSVKYHIGLGEQHGGDLDYATLMDGQSEAEPEIRIKDTDLQSIAYTSGTGGEPKGVAFSHRRWLSGLWQNAYPRMRFKSDDIFLSHFPMAMISGQFHTLSAMLAGITTVIQNFKPQLFCEMVAREKVSVTYLGGTQYLNVRDYLDRIAQSPDLSSLEYIHVGSRPMSAGQLQEMLDYFNIPYDHTHKEYGATETVPFVMSVLTGEEIARGLAADADGTWRRRVEGVGRPYLVEVKVKDPAGVELPANRIGEIVVRTEFTRGVYWRRPDLNRKRFRDGWFLTRDHGYLDADGYLYYAGRIDDMIKSGQMYVAPTEVEAVILGHAAVREVCVIGLPDPKWGEAVTAVVVAGTSGGLSEAEIKSHCRLRLASYQVPKAVYFTDALPRDPQGKVKTRQLREQYASGSG